MTKNAKRKTLRTLISALTMLALLLSMAVDAPFFTAPIVSDLANTASAENPNDDDDDEDGNNVRRVQFHDSSGNSVPAGFHSGPFTLTLNHRQREGDPVATIYYTTSQTTATWQNGFQFPYNGANDPTRMHDQLRERFDGGVCPMGYNSADREETWNFTWHPGVQQAAPGATVQVTPNPGSGNYASVFTISAMAVIPGAGGGHEVSRVRTRSFILGPNRWTNNDFMVISIYSDANGIFGWDDGVLVPGNDRRELETELARLNPSRYGLTDALGFHFLQAITSDRRNLAAAQSSPWNSLLLQGGYPPTWPANFTKRGRAAERLANIEMFDPRAPLGEQRLISQRVGLRVKGGWSRGTYSYEQRTFEFYAREEYGDRSNFLYPLFGESHTAYDGNLMHRYTRFRVRNGGTDREQLFMRDEFASVLALQSGKLDAQEYQPAAVFLNGGYYGMTMMKSPRTENHWQRLYGGRRNGFEQIGSNESGADNCGSNSCGRVIPGSTGGTDPGSGQYFERTVPQMCGEGSARCNRGDCESYWSSPNTGCTFSNCRGVNGPGSWREVRALFTGEDHSGSRTVGVPVRRDTPRPAGGNHASDGARGYPSGLQHNENWNRLNEILDLDSLFHYYALNIFGANVDWPSNNCEMWAYFPNCANGNHCINISCTTAGCERVAVRNGDMHPYLDGKWRFNPHDLEYGWGLFANGVEASATHHTSNTIHALLARSGAGVHVPGDDPEHGEWEIDNTPNPGIRHHFNASSQTFIMPALLNPYHAGADRALENRQRLANALSDIMLGSHTRANMERTFNAIWTNKENEHRHMIGHGNVRAVNDEYQVTTNQHTQGQRRISEFPRGNPWGEIPPTPYWAANNRPWEPDARVTVDSNSISTGARQMMTDFLANRGTQMQNMMGRAVPDRRLNPTSNTDRGPAGNFGLGIAWASGRTVQASVGEGGWAQINTRILGMKGLDSNDPRGASSAELRHFGNAPVTVYAYPWPGYRIAGVTNGTPVAGRLNVFETRGAASISVTFERDPAFDNIEVTAFQARAQGTQGNWIEITNNTSRTLSTRGLYMSDNFDRIDDAEIQAGPQDREFDFRWRMPAVIVRPGQTVFIRTSGSTAPASDALKGVEANFGLTFGERLRIADARGNVIQRVEVSLMTNQQMQRRGVGSNGVDDGYWRIVDWNGQRNQQMHPAR